MCLIYIPRIVPWMTAWLSLGRTAIRFLLPCLSLLLVIFYSLISFTWHYECFFVFRIAGSRITVEGQECLNMATFNFLGFLEKKSIHVRKIYAPHNWKGRAVDIESNSSVYSVNVSSFIIPLPPLPSLFQDVAAKTIRKYGVGSCGPRGFYGTVGECTHA